MACKEEKTISIKTPIGRINITGCCDGLHRVKLDRTVPTPITHFIKSDTVEIVSNPNQSKFNENIPVPVENCINWLQEYFSTFHSKNFPDFSIANQEAFQLCSNVKLTEFRKSVYTTLVSNVKYGSTISYSELANLIGNPNASRAVGSAMRNNPIPLMVPCHRVIKRSGDIGKYCGNEDPIKKWLLDYEQTNLKKNQK